MQAPQRPIARRKPTTVSIPAPKLSAQIILTTSENYISEKQATQLHGFLAGVFWKNIGFRRSPFIFSKNY
jgi:hypothetical protein